MFKTLVNAWKIKDLRQRILFTLFIILIFRIGSVFITIPFLSQAALESLFKGSNEFLGYFDIISGGALSNASLFAMSITPYINASIIMQLLTIAIPALERMVKEGGEEGKKKQAAYIRYLTIGLGLLQGFIYYITLKSYNVIDAAHHDTWSAIIIIASFTAGTALIMWLGEQITEYGIGNGISILLFAGIVSRFPAIIATALTNIKGGSLSVYLFIGMLLAAVVVIGFVVFVSNAERRLPVQYAKRVVGRKVYGGQSTYIPLKVNMTGVMPIIFASSLVSMPMIIMSFFPDVKGGFWQIFKEWTSTQSPLYIVMYFLLIIGFSFFYAFAQFNPVEISNNMKNNGGFIPGLRPGKPTSDFISKVMRKVTIIGALFLAAVAIMPILVSLGSRSLSGLALGGTTVLIVVGVALDTVKQLEAQMVMRHHKGFLE